MTVAASIKLATDFVTALSKQSTLVLLASRDQSVVSELTQAGLEPTSTDLSSALYLLSYCVTATTRLDAFSIATYLPGSHRPVS